MFNVTSQGNIIFAASQDVHIFLETAVPMSINDFLERFMIESAITLALDFM